jgi:hypothetical protein
MSSDVWSLDAYFITNVYTAIVFYCSNRRPNPLNQEHASVDQSHLSESHIYRTMGTAQHMAWVSLQQNMFCVATRMPCTRIEQVIASSGT